ncbi:MAG: aldo/keto reductase [candidate division Zixibacteria bacterium]|nr:aldo/keto reductase [Phycisphaerae bacterium]NIU14130.1 aldo/keto reductase [candidate division Zixibacteria bacterium]NIW44942.1 aldo/keto reductase [Gammaproteobacteria bacterium]
MEYVNLGKSGLKVSRICLGMMSFGTSEWRDYTLDEEESRPIIEQAIEFGVNFFDTADMYSLGVSEEVTGRALKDFAKREEVVLATKVYFPIGQGPNGRGLSRKHIMEGIDNSLKRLGTDYVDLYQIHRWDYSVPIEETMEALHDVVKAGKALYIGASSMYAWQFAKAQYTAELNGWTKFVSMQNHMNLLYREEEREMVPLCMDMGVGVIPWSPLARGFLAGNRTREGWGVTTRSKSDGMAQDYFYTDNDFDIVDRVKEVAAEHGARPAQIALAWLLHKPGITAPIVGCSNMYQLEEAVAATEIELTEENMRVLEGLYQPREVLGHS